MGKIIQVQAIKIDSTRIILIALCEDGSLWFRESYELWKRVPLDFKED